MIEIIAFILSSLIVGKTIFAFRNLLISFYALKKRKNTDFLSLNSNEPKDLLLFIPVLREQNIIRQTLNHFKLYTSKKVNLHVVVVGTYREQQDKEERREELYSVYNDYRRSTTMEQIKTHLSGLFSQESLKILWKKKDQSTFDEFQKLYDSQLSTKDVVEEWIRDYKRKILPNSPKFYYLESTKTQGNRATQLNFGFEHYVNTIQSDIDVVGVYDADSLPELKTFEAVVQAICYEGADACQQPLHFIDIAQRFSDGKKNPILVASAIYQTMWSMIKEYPNNYKYSKHTEKKMSKPYLRNVYLNGHGQFFSKSLLERIGKFPKGVITDGVQIGYRLSMINIPIKTIPYFCSDDMPRSLREIVTQHSRWYAGCMELRSAYNWSKKFTEKPPILQLIDGYHLQGAWAFAPLIVVLTFVSIFFVPSVVIKKILLSIITTALMGYIFIIPKLVLKIMDISLKVRFIDWLALPLAMILKSIGPNLYFLQRAITIIVKKEMKFGKVER